VVKTHCKIYFFLIMKLGRPAYSKESQIYVCECKDEEGIFRVESSIDGGKWSSNPDAHLEQTRDAMISMLLQETTGWFSKPLTKEWLRSRLRYTIPTSDVSPDFEGICRWTLKRLHISKESFVCEFVLSEKLSAEIPLIELQEDKETSREEKKANVLRARRRAAMALLKAERMMQSYAQEFGEDTDWEDEDEE
jgi:hypothetical protein